MQIRLFYFLFQLIKKCYSSYHVYSSKLTDERKKSLNNKKIVGTVLIYFSKACDCIPHSLHNVKLHSYDQKQPSRGVLLKRCSEKMQQIYRRTPMPKCDLLNHASAWVFSRKFTACFQNTFLKEHL